MSTKRTYTITFEGQEMVVSVERQGEALVVEHEGEEYTVFAPVEQSGHPSRPAPDRKAGVNTREGQRGDGATAAHPSGKPSGTSDSTPPGDSPTSNANSPTAGEAAGVLAPMTGTIKEILVAEGDSVVEGERLIVMEAMKMEIDVSAHAAGTVGEVLVAAGSTVKEREPLMRIE